MFKGMKSKDCKEKEGLLDFIGGAMKGKQGNIENIKNKDHVHMIN